VQEPNNTDFVNLISKFNALENMIFMRDHNITGSENIIQEV